MARYLSSTLLAVTSAASLASAAAPAAAAGAYYRAEPASTSAPERVIVRDLVWKCGAGACSSGQSNSRPEVDCAALVRRIGTVKSFAVEGRALAADALEKCNARAR